MIWITIVISANPNNALAKGNALKTLNKLKIIVCCLIPTVPDNTLSRV